MSKEDEFSEFRSPEDASFDKMVHALDRAYHKPWVMMWRAFLQGLMGAFGTAVGWILIFTLSGVIFQALGGFSLFKPITDKLQSTISDIQNQTHR